MIYFEIHQSCTITEPIEVDHYCIISKPGAYVILQSLVESLDVENPNLLHWLKSVQESYGPLNNYLAHDASSLIYWSCLEMEPDQQLLPKLHVLSLKSICSAVVSIPYDLDQFENCLDQEQWLIIVPVGHWKGSFIEEMPMFLEKEDLEEQEEPVEE